MLQILHDLSPLPVDSLEKCLYLIYLPVTLQSKSNAASSGNLPWCLWTRWKLTLSRARVPVTANFSWKVCLLLPTATPERLPGIQELHFLVPGHLGGAVCPVTTNRMRTKGVCVSSGPVWVRREDASPPPPPLCQLVRSSQALGDGGTTTQEKPWSQITVWKDFMEQSLQMTLPYSHGNLGSYLLEQLNLVLNKKISYS